MRAEEKTVVHKPVKYVLWSVEPLTLWQVEEFAPLQFNFWFLFFPIAQTSTEVPTEPTFNLKDIDISNRNWQ